MLPLFIYVLGEFYAVFAEVVNDPLSPIPLVCTMTPLAPIFYAILLATLF